MKEESGNSALRRVTEYLMKAKINILLYNICTLKHVYLSRNDFLFFSVVQLGWISLLLNELL